MNAITKSSEIVGLGPRLKVLTVGFPFLQNGESIVYVHNGDAYIRGGGGGGCQKLKWSSLPYDLQCITNDSHDEDLVFGTRRCKWQSTNHGNDDA